MVELFKRFHEFFEEKGSGKFSQARLNSFLALLVALYLVILDTVWANASVNFEFVITLLAYAFGAKFAQKKGENSAGK